jgi:hypothetical protein
MQHINQDSSLEPTNQWYVSHKKTIPQQWQKYLHHCGSEWFWYKTHKNFMTELQLIWNTIVLKSTKDTSHGGQYNVFIFTSFRPQTSTLEAENNRFLGKVRKAEPRLSSYDWNSRLHRQASTKTRQTKAPVLVRQNIYRQHHTTYRTPRIYVLENRLVFHSIFEIKYLSCASHLLF